MLVDVALLLPAMDRKGVGSQTVRESGSQDRLVVLAYHEIVEQLEAIHPALAVSPSPRTISPRRDF